MMKSLNKACLLVIRGRMLGVLSTLLLVCGCQQETDILDDSGDFNEDIVFMATVMETDDLVMTRANNSVSDVTYTAFPDVDFYIYEKSNDAPGTENPKIGKYWVQSGTQGMLWPKTSSERLSWFSRDSEHYFWSWTVPWKDRDTFVPTLSPVPLIFPNSSITEQNEQDFWNNGLCLEQCVGALNGPFVYNIDGIYIPIQYRHLLSKIRLNYLSVVNNATGSTYTNLKGNITFLGLPNEATLYPVTDNEAEGNKKAPYIAMPEDFDYNQDDGVTYYFLNKRTSSSSTSTPYDVFYICPEVDFSKLAFKIEIYQEIDDPENPGQKKWVLNTSHGNRGAFYGDFRNVSFSRSSNGNNYDNPEGGDSKILHASEYMDMVISVNSQGVPIVKVTVSSWTTPGGNNNYQATQHIHPGIYADGELHDLSNMFAPSSTASQEEKDAFYEMYGDGVVSSDPDNPNYFPGLEDKKIFHLYEDLTVYGRSLYVDKEYMVDGMGHLVNFGRSTSTSVNVGKNVRNVFLRINDYYDSSKIYMVYIDREGKIWKVDPETLEMIPTSYSLANTNYDPVSIYLPSGSLSKGS